MADYTLMPVGALADKIAEAARVGETFEPEILVYDPDTNVMSAAKALVKAETTPVAVLSLVNHYNGDELTCSRDMEIYIIEHGWKKANEVKMGDRSKMAALSRATDKYTAIASKFLKLKYPSVNMDVISVAVKGDVQSFFIGSALVRNPVK
jgi:hypothetical protein